MEDYEFDNRLIDAASALAAGDHVRALAILDQLEAQWPRTVPVCALRARALLAGGDAAAAMDDARRCVELRGEDPELLALMAEAAWKTDKLSLAQQSYEKAVERAPNDALLRADFAWFLAACRGPKLAEAAARAALEIDPAVVTAWAALGVAQHRQHRPDEAEGSLRRALELDPNDVNAQAALLRVFHDRRQDGKALALASFMAEQGEASQIVAALESDAKQRQLARMLVERNVTIGPRDMPSSRPWVKWLAIGIAIALLLGSLWMPTLWGTVAVGLGLPVFVLWLLRRLAD